MLPTGEGPALEVEQSEVVPQPGQVLATNPFAQPGQARQLGGTDVGEVRQPDRVEPAGGLGRHVGCRGAPRHPHDVTQPALGEATQQQRDVTAVRVRDHDRPPQTPAEVHLVQCVEHVAPAWAVALSCRQAGAGTPAGVAVPALRELKPPVHRTARVGAREEHGQPELAVERSTGRGGVLAGDADGPFTMLREHGLLDDPGTCPDRLDTPSQYSPHRFPRPRALVQELLQRLVHRPAGDVVGDVPDRLPAGHVQQAAQIYLAPFPLIGPR